jgi:2-polyprenyl-3-methyl-5-hydroxy-6-metoxy-1,4-benzoquinol methylase
MSLAPIDYYDCEERGLEEDRPLLQREQKSIQLIRKYVPEKKDIHILDVGCGNGSFLQELDKSLARNYHYHGVDYSEYKVKKASSLPYEFRRCNLEEGIPYEDETFDVVYSGEVIEHLYNPDYMLEECYRVLKPNGLLIISTPNLQAWYNRVLFFVGIQPLFYEVSTKSSYIGAGPLRRIKKQTVPVGHLRVFNRRGLLDLIENEGFEVISITGAMFQSLPKSVQLVDNIFNAIPSLASNLVVTARRRPKASR